MGVTIIRPGILRHLCKEPLGEVESVRLRGRGILRLLELDACPNLISLDVSSNALKELDEATGLSKCRNLWMLDASNNSLEAIGGLYSFMALGHLNLSNNPIPLEELWPIARSHVLELVLGRDRHIKMRSRILRLLPNVWVLDEEYVTVKERRDAETSKGFGNLDGGANSSDHLTWSDAIVRKPTERKGARGVGASVDRLASSARADCRARRDSPFQYPSANRDLGRQSQQTRRFFENVVCKLPCRAEAADSFRLRTLLEHYDRRVITTNNWMWSSTFTRGGNSSRQDWSEPLPRSHVDFLRSLPLRLRLDVTALLTARVAFRHSLPRQVLAEAFMILLASYRGTPDRVHSDLSRIPPFVCTALVHILRSSVLEERSHIHGSGPGSTADLHVLDEREIGLLDALPPVLTGIDNALEEWNSRERMRSGGKPDKDPKGDEQLPHASRSDDPSSIKVEPRSPLPSTNGDKSCENVITVAQYPANTTTDTSKIPRTITESIQRSAAYTPLMGVGLTHLCQRVVAMLMRSPTCPNLVREETVPMKRRLYDQMSPLLARAKMGYEDLHTGPLQSRTKANSWRVTCGSREAGVSSVRMSIRGGVEGTETVDPVEGETGPNSVRPATVHGVRSIDDSGWCPYLRIPRPGERIQVLQDSWSVIVSTCSDSASVTVAPFLGIQGPPYWGLTRLDCRGLFFDPRGWWRHAAAFKGKPPPSSRWLYRQPRGFSASGMPRGASSRNKPLGYLDETRCGTQVASCRNTGKEPEHACGSEPSARKFASNHQGAASSSATLPFSCRVNNVLEVFSAEGTWDPAFVLAPARLVGLQNRMTLREIGLPRAKRIAWRCIDKPEMGGVEVRGDARADCRRVKIRDVPACSTTAMANRSMIPRCYSKELATTGATNGRYSWSAPALGLRPSLAQGSMRVSQPTSIPGSCCHGGTVSTCHRLIPKSSVAPGSMDSLVTAESSGTVGYAWLELQREMGSLKADNRIMSRGEEGTNDRSGTSMQPRRVRTLWTIALSEAMSITPSSDGSVESQAPGNTQPQALASSATTGRGSFDDTALHDSKRSGVPAAARVRESKVDELSKTATTITACTDGRLRAFSSSNQSPRRDPRRRRRRRPTRLSSLSRGGSGLNSAAMACPWKANANRPLEWFPVHSRQVLLLDPGFVTTTGTTHQQIWSRSSRRVADSAATPRAQKKEVTVGRRKLRDVDSGQEYQRGGRNQKGKTQGGKLR